MNPVRVEEVTPAGRGGVSVLLVRGPGALARVAALVEGDAPVTGALRLARLQAAGELLDEALLWVAGDESVELHLHGSPPVVDRVRTALAPVAEAEVQSSLEARAAARVGGAPTEAGARTLLDQAGGALRPALVACLSAAGEDLARRVAALLERGRVLEWLSVPPLVVLAGPVNAGKSTLFNALVGRERVVVHPEQGTTRDAVRERVLLGAFAVDLVDTAGERTLPGAEGCAAAETVERAGQALGRELRARADLVLHLAPAAAGAPERAERTLVLSSRADELAAGERAGLRRAIAARDEPERTRDLVVACLHEALELPLEPWEPGAAVPFEPSQMDLLRRLIRAGGAASEAKRDLESLLTR